MKTKPLQTVSTISGSQLNMYCIFRDRETMRKDYHFFFFTRCFCFENTRKSGHVQSEKKGSYFKLRKNGINRVKSRLYKDKSF